MVRILLFITLLAVGASGYFAYNDVNAKIVGLTDNLDIANEETRVATEEKDKALTAQSEAKAEAEAQAEADVKAEAGRLARAIRVTSWWKGSPVAPTALLSWPRLGGTPGG